MKYTICVRRPEQEENFNEVVNNVTEIVLKGTTVHRRLRCDVKGFVEPIHEDGTPAVELGYIYMLVEAPMMRYLKDRIEYCLEFTIQEGWPKKGTVKRYPGT